MNNQTIRNAYKLNIAKSYIIFKDTLIVIYPLYMYIHKDKIM